MADSDDDDESSSSCAPEKSKLTVVMSAGAPPLLMQPLKCECVLTRSLDIMEHHLSKLMTNHRPSLTENQQIHQLHIALVELRKCANQHAAFRLDYARAMVELQKRDAINSVPALQTTSTPVGRERTRQLEAESERRRLAIESGRIRKRPPTTTPGQNRRKKRNAL